MSPFSLGGGFIPRSGISRSYGNSVVNFLRQGRGVFEVRGWQMGGGHEGKKWGAKALGSERPQSPHVASHCGFGPMTNLLCLFVHL